MKSDKKSDKSLTSQRLYLIIYVLFYHIIYILLIYPSYYLYTGIWRKNYMKEISIIILLFTLYL